MVLGVLAPVAKGIAAATLPPDSFYRQISRQHDGGMQASVVVPSSVGAVAGW